MVSIRPRAAALLDENRAIHLAIKQVRAKPDMRVCNPGRWRVFTCPLTSMVVVERKQDMTDAQT